MGDQSTPDVSGTGASPSGPPSTPSYPPPPPGAYPPPPQPPAPPAAPPVPPGAPQPVAPSMPAATPGEPAPAPPKKRRGGMWFGLGIGCLVIVLLIGCGAIALFGAFGSKSKSKDAYAQAESHYAAAAAAMQSMESAANALDSTSDSTAAIKQFQASVGPAVTTADKELDAAQAALSGVPDSQAKTAYVASLASARKALDEIGAMSSQLGDVNTLMVKVTPLPKELTAAKGNLESAIRAVESGSYGTAIDKGRKAADQYATVESQLRTLESDYPSLGFRSLVTEISVRRQLAEQLVAAGKAGQERNASRYSGAVDKANALIRKTGRGEVPAALDNPDLLLKDFYASYKRALAALTRAQAQHDAAIKAIDSGNY